MPECLLKISCHFLKVGEVAGSLCPYDMHNHVCDKVTHSIPVRSNQINCKKSTKNTLLKNQYPSIFFIQVIKELSYDLHVSMFQ